MANPLYPFPMNQLADRIKAIEDRQRDHEMHDPDCPIRRAEKGNAKQLVPCNCWLAPKVEPIFKITIGDGSSYVFNVTHNQGSQELYLGKRELEVTVIDLTAQGTSINLLHTSYGPQLVHMDLQTIQLRFPSTSPPPSNSIEVTVISKEKP
jgi:hypothetical protein